MFTVWNFFFYVFPLYDVKQKNNRHNVYTSAAISLAQETLFWGQIELKLKHFQLMFLSCWHTFKYFEIDIHFVSNVQIP